MGNIYDNYKILDDDYVVTKPQISYVDNFIAGVENFLFPPKCGGCGVPGPLICEDCVTKFKTFNEQICLVCGKPSVKSHTHENCYTKFTPEKFTGIYTYAPPLSKIIQKIKYTPHATSLLKPLLEEVAKEIDERGIEFGTEAIIIPIPLHWFKKWQRGFNVPEEIAKIIGSKYQLTVRPDFLKRVKNTSTQTKLKRWERAQNVAGAFAVPNKYRGQIVGKDILLIDDVCTTGATLLSAARTLKEAGCGQVWCFSLAKD